MIESVKAKDTQSKTVSYNGEPKLGTFSTLSIGIGGMVGGGIFAVTGLTVEVTKGAAPIAFLVAGIVALLTSYSYLKLTLRFPGEGGTVEFLNRAFGGGIVTGAANILLLLSYVVLLAVYAYAFGSYGAGFFPKQDHGFWLHTLISTVIVGGHPRILKNPPPKGLFVGFGDSSIDFDFRVWTDQFADWSKVRSEMAIAVHDAVQAAGMSFPFPQREVRLLRDEEA